MSDKFLAIVNPAAGGGRCGQLAPAALQNLAESGIEIEVARTTRAGEATEIARAAYARGIRRFLAVGGDGTSHEIVNGLFPEAANTPTERPTLGFLPLGTGNSFLRDFSTEGLAYSLKAIREGKRCACDVIRLRHAEGDIYFLNLFSLGFPADVAETTNRRFKGLGEIGYILGVFSRLMGLMYSAFPYRLDGHGDWDRRPCLFLAFTNSKFTGGKMMIAPKADASDGLIECVRWAPVGRLQLLWNFPGLFSGAHIDHAFASRAGARRVEFALDGPVNVMIDGESLKLKCEALEVVPGALDVMA
jgi:diacylglycerol kinase (ATP)